MPGKNPTAEVIDSIRSLVEKGTWQKEPAAKLSAWCKEVGLTALAEKLDKRMEPSWWLIRDLENLSVLVGMTPPLRAPGSMREYMGNLTHGEIQIMGFERVKIPSNQTAWITNTPAMPVRILDLTLAKECASDLHVDQIVCNGKHTMVNSSSIKGDEWNKKQPLEFPELPTGGFIQIQVTNNTEKTVEFNASMRVRVMW